MKRARITLAIVCLALAAALAGWLALRGATASERGAGWSPAVDSLTIHLEGKVQSMERPAGEGDESVSFDVLFPGRYEASAVVRIDGKEERWSERVVVEVAPEDDAGVILELRAP